MLGGIEKGKRVELRGGRAFAAYAICDLGGLDSPGRGWQLGRKQGQPTTWDISLGRQQRNDLPPMPAIAAEIRVQCEHLAIGVQFGEPHQARIGQRHGGVLLVPIRVLG